MRVLFRHVLLVFLCVAVSACVSIRLDENLSDYTSEIARLQQEIRDNAQDSNALRDLGAIYMRTGNPIEASRYLQDAYVLGSRDPKLLFYLAFANESLGRTDTALRVYETFTDLPSGNPYRRLMSGRYASLIRDIAQEEIRGRVADETSISSDEIISNAVAIFALEYRGDNPAYANIGRGLAEWLTLDLLKVSQLNIVERVRLQALLDEIALGASGSVDPSSAPRAGRILRAGRVVSGTYDVLSGDNLQVVAAHVETTSAEAQTLPSQMDALENFFRLEKRVVFALLADLGIELTEAEQNQIDAVPTQNLQAFLAYSRGLASEDEGDFGAAASFFQQASQLDPGFQIASARGETALGMAATYGASGVALTSARNLEPHIVSPFDPVTDRLDNLGISVEAPIIPGADARQPAVEGPLSAPKVLADPPRPPGGN